MFIVDCEMSLYIANIMTILTICQTECLAEKFNCQLSKVNCRFPLHFFDFNVIIILKLKNPRKTGFFINFVNL